MKLISLSLLFVIFGTVQLVSNTAPDTIQLGQIEVRASAIRLVEEIRKLEFDSLSMNTFKSHDLSLMLRQNSPVFIKENGFGGLSTASFRGTAANHTVVLWNGVPINGPQLGQVDFSVIPVFLMDKVSVVAGTAGVQQAAGIGGVVTVDNVPAFGRNLSIEAMQTAGSFSSFGSYLSVKAGNEKFVAQTRLFRKRSENDFYYLNTAAWPSQEMKHDNASWFDQGFLQEFHLHAKNTVLSFASWNQWNERNLPPIMTNVGRGGNPKEYQHDAFSRNVITWKYYIGSLKLANRVSYFNESQNYYLKTTSSFEPYAIVTLIDSDNRFQSWQNNFSANYQKTKYIIEAAFDFGLENVQTDNYLENPSRLSFGLTGRAAFYISNALSLKGQIRIESVNHSIPGVQPFFELSYSPKRLKGLSINGTLGRVLRFPTMNDLYWFPGGNPDLKPERSLQSSLNIAYEAISHRVVSKSKVSIYVSDIKDWIQWRPTTFMYWVPENVARVFARGFELNQQLDFQCGAWKMSIRGNYAFTLTTDESPVAKLDNYSGRQLIYIPRHHGNLMLRADYKEAYLNINSDYVGKRHVSYNDDHLIYDYLPAYQLIGIGVGYRFKHVETTLKVNNLLDKEYQAVLWRPMPGRYFELVFSYKLDIKRNRDVD